MRARIAMAIEAPAHDERLLLLDDFHLINPTVTFHAADAAVDMRGVVEKHVVRQLVDAHPLHWLVTRRTVADRLQQGTVLLG